jgi:ribosomal protein S3
MTYHSWKQKYIEKNAYELHTNVFTSLEIEQYLKKILKNYNFNLHDLKFNFSNTVLNIFVSVYKTKQTKIINNKKTTIKKKNKITNLLQKKILKNSPRKLKYLKILNFKKYNLIQFQKNIKLKNISNKIIESLTVFTKNKFNILLTIKEINFINRKLERKVFSNLKKFNKTPFFEEGITLATPLLIQRNSANLLGNFIALQLKTKRHNFFIDFLKKSLNFNINKKFSKIKGIKIILKGRLNNTARSKNYIIKLGKLSLTKIKSKINYSESIAFTSNGTIGVKVWICEKM